MITVLFMFGSGLVPAAPMSLGSGSCVATMLSAMLGLCIAVLWTERDRSRRTPATAARPRPRSAARGFRRLTIVPRPLS
jgi:uncharacterized membrane protein YccC